MVTVIRNVALVVAVLSTIAIIVVVYVVQHS